MAELSGDRQPGGPEPSTEGAERFRRIFLHSHDGIFLLDPEEDRILDVNPQACTLLGYTREELLALPISAVHPDEMPRLLAFSRSVVKEGHGWTDELTCTTKAGNLLASEISAAVIRVGGRPCIAAFVRDVSRRKRLEEALQRHSEELEKLVQKRTSALRQSREELRALLELNNAILGSLERDILFDAVGRVMAGFLDYDRAALLLHRPGRDVLESYAVAGPLSDRLPWKLGTELPRGSIRSWQAVQERRPVLVRDLEQRPLTEFERQLAASGIRSLLVVPLISGDTVLGGLAVGHSSPDHYGEDDLAFLTKAASQVAIAVEKMLAFEEVHRLKDELEREKVYLQEEIKTEHNFEEIVGESKALREVLRAVEQVAATDATVLVCGETGTGKELVARAVHSLSERSHKPLIKVNCAALPAGLIESELFGHEKGAFTGALSRKQGRFELADGGTIFLDEIGDLPAELQAKLLRVLQEGELERVGGTQTITVDVRVIAATNRNLDEAVEQGRFRADLFYRLNVFPIEVPPLRERRGDIPLLVNYFTMRQGRGTGKLIKSVPARVMRRLVTYSWPGNVRELQNVVDRAVILSRGESLEVGDWFLAEEAATSEGDLLPLDAVQRQHIVAVLEQTDWKVSGESGAAEILGLKPTTLEYRMRKLGIERPGR